jgi:hypothetical protein
MTISPLIAERATEKGRESAGAILALANFAKPIIISPLLALPTRNISPGRAVRIVVVDPLVCGLQDFVD